MQPRAEILRVNLTLESGQAATFSLGLSEDPREAVNAFAKVNKLPPKVRSQLLREVLKQLHPSDSRVHQDRFAEDMDKQIEQAASLLGMASQPVAQAHEPSPLPSQPSVFDKLYSEGISQLHKRDKQRIELTRNEMAQLAQNRVDREGADSQSVVNRLYYKGVASQQSKRLRRDQLSALKQMEEERECTYQPILSPISEALARELQKQNQPVEDRLLQLSAFKAKALHTQAAVKLATEIAEVQDKPKINELSREIAREKSRTGSRHQPKHEQLFEDSIVRQQKLALLQEAKVDNECTFRPQLNPDSLRLVEEKHPQEDVLKRFDRLAKEREGKIMLERANTNPPLTETLDPDTQQPYFHPITGRAPVERHPQSAREVGTYLHGLSTARLERLQMKRDQLYSRELAKKEAIPSSTQIVETRKREIFKQIFEGLDSDKDGVISAEKVNIECLPSEILKIVSPLLINMEELRMEIDEQTFLYGMQEIYRKLSQPEKNKILKAGKEKQSNEPSFTPILCPYSLELAANKPSIVTGRKQSGRTLGKIKEENWESRSMQREELRDGDFQPMLTPYQPEHSHYV
jgi:hypothetical protein